MHHRAKLSFEAVQMIRKVYASGTIGYSMLSRAFKCGESTIRDIVTYRTRVSK